MKIVKIGEFHDDRKLLIEAHTYEEGEIIDDMHEQIIKKLKEIKIK